MIRGAVYKVDFGTHDQGRVQRGKRRAIVISSAPGSWSVATVIPTSTRAQEAIFRPLIEVEGQKTRALIDQIRTIDVRDIGEMVAFLNPDEMEEIEDALMRFLRLGK